MFTHVNADEIDPYDIEAIDPDLLPVGLELKPSETRPSIWSYEAGESNNLHHQQEQEELYVPLSGRFEMNIDDETIEIESGDLVVVEPAAERQLTALEGGRILVIGAPPVKDDGIVVEGSE